MLALGWSFLLEVEVGPCFLELVWALLSSCLEWRVGPSFSGSGPAFLLGVGGWPFLLGVGFRPTWSGGWPSFSGLAFLLGLGPRVLVLGLEVGPSFSGLALPSRGRGGLSSPTSRVDGRQHYKMENSATYQKGARRKYSTLPKVKGRVRHLQRREGLSLTVLLRMGLRLGLGFPSQSWDWPSSPPFMELGFGAPFWR